MFENGSSQFGVEMGDFAVKNVNCLGFWEHKPEHKKEVSIGPGYLY